MGNPTHFVEIASGHIANRGMADLIANLPSLIGVSSAKRELYHSWYSFDQEIQSHLDGKNSISTFKGVYYVDQIILDVDFKELSETERLQAVKFFVNTDLLEDLSIKEEHIQVWYSGTGFHVVLPDLFGFTPSTTLPFSVKATLETVFPDADKIYDGARLIRAPFSYNKKSKLFKVPLTLRELNTFSIEDIKKKASTVPDEINLNQYAFKNVEHYLKQYLKLEVEKVYKNVTAQKSTFDIDPTTVVTCMQTLLSKPPIPGERNESMMRIAAWYRRSGIPKESVIQTLMSWTGNKEEAISTVNSVYDKGYNYWCNDYIMSKYCDPKCIHFKRKDYSMPIENMSTLAEKYKEFIESGISKSAFNFKDLYRSWNSDFWIMPGELVILLGDTGMGKSTYLSNLAVLLRKHKIMYLSLENTWHLTYRRLVQISLGYSKDQSNKYHKELEDMSNLYDSIDHIHAVHKCPEIEKLEEEVARFDPDIVMVDPTNKLIVKNVHNEFDKMNAIITKLKDIAVNQECVVVAVHHINKESAKTGYVDINSAKGSSTVVQEADKVLTLNGTRIENGRIITSDKNRDGKGLKIMFQFNKEHMTFDEPPPITLHDQSF